MARRTVAENIPEQGEMKQTLNPNKYRAGFVEGNADGVPDTSGT